MITVTFLGHACFLLQANGKTILIDPFLSDNPTATKKPEELKPDLILVTHGHGDHLGDAVSISKATGAEILGVFELMNYCAEQGAERVHHAHMGGKISYDFGWVKLVPAFHSSSGPDGTYTGNPCGFIINFFGHSFYHAGDTSLFGDMELFGRVYGIDTAMLPIGGTFTMDMYDAVEAAKLLKCETIIPMHYNTFPPVEADPDQFKGLVEGQTPIKVAVLKCGESMQVQEKTKIGAGR